MEPVTKYRTKQRNFKSAWASETSTRRIEHSLIAREGKSAIFLFRSQQLQHPLSQSPTTAFDMAHLVNITNPLRDEFVTFWEVVNVSDNNAWVYLKGFRGINNYKRSPKHLQLVRMGGREKKYKIDWEDLLTWIPWIEGMIQHNTTLTTSTIT